MKIYTKTGDKGETGLVGGGRVAKDSLRMEVIGTLDELNALLGLAVAKMEKKEELGGIGGEKAKMGGGFATFHERLLALQRRLFDVGADVATPVDSKVQVRRMDEEDVATLESWIDEVQAELEPLRNFILPGGGEVAGFLHLARAVCRRGERALVALYKQDGGCEVVLRFLNRLSDLLFVLAREANRLEGLVEDVWRSGESES